MCMDLTISNCNNFYSLKGILNRNNVYMFQQAFKNIFEKSNTVTISIEDLESIDRYGVNAIARLHDEAIAKNKKFAIVGLGCKDLYDYFKSGKAA